MAQILACPNCQRQLQIPESFTGQLVQCPDCRHQFEAQAPAAAVQSAAPKAAPSKAGKKFEDEEDERESYGRRRRDDEYDDDVDDLRISRRKRQEPHRGVVVLVLGILSICCVGAPVTGIIAWVLGNNDLRAMDEGRMDPTGRGQTQTGKILGMISTILSILGALGYCLLILVAALGGAMGPRRRR